MVIDTREVQEENTLLLIVVTEVEMMMDTREEQE